MRVDTDAAGREPRRGRYLVLCHDYDEAAIWAHERLAARGQLDGDLVRGGDLDLAARWTHRLEGEGDAVEIGLADGTTLDGKAYDGVLNRLVTAPGSLAAFASDEDREYAEAEAVAFAMSWLAVLPNVVNPPTPQGLSGAWRHITDWLRLAAQAGLATPDYRQTEADRPEQGYGSIAPPDAPVVVVLVAGEAILGDPPSREIGEACRRLARLSGADILGVELFAAAPGDWRFAHASTFPDLRTGGEPLIEALAHRLTGART